MKTKHKILTILSLSAIAAASTAMINKLITLSATSKKLYSSSKYSIYKWRFGNIAYKKYGKGKPLLLIHDISPTGSSYEWHKLIDELKSTNTVYTLDLLGCGLSEKVDMTYTNYLYVQLISDFIRDIIGHRTDIVCSGSSSSIAIMGCLNNADLFDKIILINPDSLIKCSQTPSKRTKFYKLLINTPIIGTLIYNIAFSKKSIEEMFCNEYYANPYAIRRDEINTCHEVAHIGNYFAKKIYASQKGKYISIGISHALEKIDNSIIIIGGSEVDHINDIIDEYKEHNPSIESVILTHSKKMPQLETPKKLYQTLKIYFKI